MKYKSWRPRLRQTRLSKIYIDPRNNIIANRHRAVMQKRHAAATRLQRWFRKLRWSHFHFVNDKDPVTMEPITGMPFRNIIEPKTNKNSSQSNRHTQTLTTRAHVYKFQPETLVEYIFKQNKFVNYLTRAPLNEIELKRLDRAIAFNREQKTQTRSNQTPNATNVAPQSGIARGDQTQSVYNYYKSQRNRQPPMHYAQDELLTQDVLASLGFLPHGGLHGPHDLINNDEEWFSTLPMMMFSVNDPYGNGDGNGNGDEKFNILPMPNVNSFGFPQMLQMMLSMQHGMHNQQHGHYNAQYRHADVNDGYRQPVQMSHQMIVGSSEEPIDLEMQNPIDMLRHMRSLFLF